MIGVVRDGVEGWGGATTAEGVEGVGCAVANNDDAAEGAGCRGGGGGGGDDDGGRCVSLPGVAFSPCSSRFCPRRIGCKRYEDPRDDFSFFECLGFEDETFNVLVADVVELLL